MKTINVTFDDEEFERLEMVKADSSWREVILTLIEPCKEPTRKKVLK